MERVVQTSRIEKATLAIAVVVVAICAWFTQAEVTGLLGNTLRLAFASATFALPIAMVLAYLLSRSRVWGSSFWHGCLLLLLFVPLCIQLAGWEAGLGRGGWYSTLIAKTLTDPPLEGLRGAAWIHAVASIPWLFWMLRLGFHSVPSVYEEMAALDATRWQVFRRVTLPLLLPVALAGCLYVLILAATEITVTSRYQFRSYAEVLYSEFVLNDRFNELPLSIAPILLTLTCVTSAGLAVCKLLLPRIRWLTIDRVSPATSKAISWRSTAVVAGIVGSLLLFPICNLFYQAGIDVQGDEASGLRVRAWSFTKMLQLIGGSPWDFREELAYSAVMSQISVIATLVGATLLAWWAKGHKIREACAAFAATSCFVVPGPFVGLALIWLLNRDNAVLAWLYDDTVFAPCLAMSIRCFPFVYLIVWYGLCSTSTAILDAAAIDGADRWRLFWHVLLPSLTPSLVCAVLVGLAVCVGEVSASILVMPPGVTTVSTEIFQLIHYGADDRLAGLCLSCLAVFLLLSLIAGVALRRLIRAAK